MCYWASGGVFSITVYYATTGDWFHFALGVITTVGWIIMGEYLDITTSKTKKFDQRTERYSTWVPFYTCAHCFNELTFGAIMDNHAVCPVCGVKDKNAVTIVAHTTGSKRKIKNGPNAGKWQYKKDTAQERIQEFSKN